MFGNSNASEFATGVWFKANLFIKIKVFLSQVAQESGDQENLEDATAIHGQMFKRAKLAVLSC